MATNQKRSSPWFAAVLFLLAMYVGSYFVLSDYDSEIDITVPDGPSFTMDTDIRFFRHKWIVDFYKPIVYVEVKVRGKPLYVWPNDQPLMIDRP